MSMRSLHLFGIICSVFVSVMCAAPVQAQKILGQFEKPLPAITPLPESEFLAKTALMEAVPVGDKTLQYEMRYLKGWTVDKAVNMGGSNNEKKIMQETSVLNGPYNENGSKSWIEVKTGALDYNMTAQEWLIRHMLENGYGVLGTKFYNNKKAEALYIYVKNSETYNVRTVVILNGNNLLLVSYWVPAAYWEDEKSMQAQVIKSVTLKAERAIYKEKVLTFDFLDIAELSYPYAWSLKPMSETSVVRMKVALFNYGIILENNQRKLDGRVDIEMSATINTKSYEEAWGQYKLDSQTNGMALGDIIEKPDDFILNPNFDFAQTEVYSATNVIDKLIDYEFWVTAVSFKEYYFFVSLLTPSRDYDYFAWSKNREHYRSIINGLNSQKKPFEDLMKAHEKSGEGGAPAIP